MCKYAPTETVTMHVVYKYYINMAVNRLLVLHKNHGTSVDGIHMEICPGLVSLSHIQSGVTTDVLGRPSTCAVHLSLMG